MTETKPTKMQETFAADWEEGLEDAVKGQFLRDSNMEKDALLKIASVAYLAGARAFSTMPLCEHGTAVWGVEHCDLCSAIVNGAIKELTGKQEEAVVAQDFDLAASLRNKVDTLKKNRVPEFPGYNKPFGADLPEGMTEGHLADLKAEHEAMRQTIFQILIKVEALDPEAVNAPWEPVNLLHFVGLWLSGSLPFANTKMVTVLQRLLRDLQGLEARFLTHMKDHHTESESSGDGS